jgi:hypothetical protein
MLTLPAVSYVRSRLVGAILAEQHDERQTSVRRYLPASQIVTLDLEQHITPELEAAKHDDHRQGPHPIHQSTERCQPTR